MSHLVIKMTFKYLRDPLFLCCVFLYFLNRLILKPHFNIAFFHNSLNDLICIPFWVPILLWFMRKFGLRDDDEPPQWYEILFPLILWSAVFEVLLPQLKLFQGIAIADPSDVLYYVLGACIASMFWQTWYSRNGIIKE